MASSALQRRRVAVLEDAALNSRGLTWRPLEFVGAELLSADSSPRELVDALSPEDRVTVHFGGPSP